MGFQNANENEFHGFGNLVIWVWKSFGKVLEIWLFGFGKGLERFWKFGYLGLEKVWKGFGNLVIWVWKRFGKVL